MSGVLLYYLNWMYRLMCFTCMRALQTEGEKFLYHPSIWLCVYSKIIFSLYFRVVQFYTLLLIFFPRWAGYRRFLEIPTSIIQQASIKILTSWVNIFSYLKIFDQYTDNVYKWRFHLTNIAEEQRNSRWWSTINHVDK